MAGFARGVTNGPHPSPYYQGRDRTLAPSPWKKVRYRVCVKRESLMAEPLADHYGFSLRPQRTVGVVYQVNQATPKAPPSFEENRVSYHYIPMTRGALDVRASVEDLRHPTPRIDIGVVNTPFAPLRRVLAPRHGVLQDAPQRDDRVSAGLSRYMERIHETVHALCDEEYAAPSQGAWENRVYVFYRRGLTTETTHQDGADQPTGPMVEAFTLAPSLRFPDYRSRLVLHVTWDAHHIGGVITQEFLGVPETVSMYARALTSPEKLLAPLESARLAFVAALRTFEGYLAKTDFAIRIDPRQPALRTLDNPRDPAELLGQWLGVVAHLRFDIQVANDSIKVPNCLGEFFASGLIVGWHPLPLRLEAHAHYAPPEPLSIASPPLFSPPTPVSSPTDEERPPLQRRRTPTRRCATSIRAAVYPGASRTGHSRLGEDYQVSVPPTNESSLVQWGGKSWGSASVFRYSMGVGTIFLEQPSVDSVSRYPRPQAVFGLHSYKRSVESFQIVHPRKRKRNLSLSIPACSMVLVLKGYNDRECLIPFECDAPVISVAAYLYAKLVAPSGNDPLHKGDHVFDYRAPFDVVHYAPKSKLEKEFIRAVWVKFFALVKTRRPLFDYVSIVRHTGQLVKECLLNTLAVPQGLPLPTDRTSFRMRGFAHVPLRNDHRAHKVLRADVRPPIRPYVLGREVPEAPVTATA